MVIVELAILVLGVTALTSDDLTPFTPEGTGGMASRPRSAC